MTPDEVDEMHQTAKRRVWLRRLMAGWEQRTLHEKYSVVQVTVVEDDALTTVKQAAAQTEKARAQHKARAT